MRKRVWVLSAVVVLALGAWGWTSCGEAVEAQELAVPTAQAIAPPEPVRGVVAVPPEGEPEPTQPPRAARDAGRPGWDLGSGVVRDPPGTRLAQVPPVVREAVEAAQAECEQKVTRWLGSEAALMADLELQATDAGVSVRFKAQGTPMLRCATRLLKSQRFDVELPGQKVVAAYFDKRKHPGGGVLPDVAAVLALVQKCAPSGASSAPITLSTTARVRGNEVVVDKPVVDSVGLDAWARSCIELGLARTVAFDDDSRPSWSSMTLELSTDAKGRNSGASMAYEP